MLQCHDCRDVDNPYTQLRLIFDNMNGDREPKGTPPLSKNIFACQLRSTFTQDEAFEAAWFLLGDVSESSQEYDATTEIQRLLRLASVDEQRSEKSTAARRQNTASKTGTSARIIYGA